MADKTSPAAVPADTVIEVDHDETDRALESESDSMSDTTSVASSVRQYRVENGRRYHSFKDGKYVFPNDDMENDRLDLQHELSLLTTGGKLYLSPIGSNPQNVLDIGTGTGIWVTDFADKHPSAQVIGTDLSPIQPTFVSPNAKFLIDDAEDQWVFSQKFDLIHGRMLVGSLKDTQSFFKQASSNLAPGGWLEMQDMFIPPLSDDDSLKGTTILRWQEVLLEATIKLGRPMNTPSKYKQWMGEAGLTNVSEVIYKWPMNTWPKSQKYKDLGAWQLVNVLEGVEGFTLGLFTRVLGWSKEQVEALLVDVRKDLRNKKIHAYWNIYFVYGQKPEN